MSTDRELLELAARAAGLHSHRYCEPWKGMAQYTMADGYFGPTWNPLTDDGDALRLAVKLKLNILQGDFSVAVNDEASVDECLIVGDAGERPETVRRAIVRAAAAMGEKA